MASRSTFECVVVGSRWGVILVVMHGLVGEVWGWCQWLQMENGSIVGIVASSEDVLRGYMLSYRSSCTMGVWVCKMSKEGINFGQCFLHSSITARLQRIINVIPDASGFTIGHRDHHGEKEDWLGFYSISHRI